MKLGYAFTWLVNPNLGGWDVNIVTGAMPQKVATAIGELGEKLVGCSYEPIAYLGSQLANGKNHAVLAKQTVIGVEDNTRIVVLYFTEKADGATLYGIEPVVDFGGKLGGWNFDPRVGKAMPEDALEAFKSVTEGWVGASLYPAAWLGSKVVKGTNHIFLAKVTPMTREGKAEAKLIMVNSLTRTIDFIDLL